MTIIVKPPQYDYCRLSISRYTKNTDNYIAYS